MAPSTTAECFRLRAEITAMLSHNMHDITLYGYLAPTSLTWMAIGVMPVCFADVDASTLSPKLCGKDATIERRAELARALLCAFNTLRCQDEYSLEVLRELHELIPLCGTTHAAAWECYIRHLNMLQFEKQHKTRKEMIVHRLLCANELLKASAQVAGQTYMLLRKLGVSYTDVFEEA